MEFELTPEIVDDVVFAMEDQSNLSVFDAVELKCRSAEEAETELVITSYSIHYTKLYEPAPDP